MSIQYEVNDPIVVGEVISGEAIVLHLQRGNYFSMRGSGALIWAGVEQKAALNKIAGALQAHYGVAADDALEAVKAFVSELAGHDLIREGSCFNAEPVAVPSDLEASYSDPSLEIYTDMQDLLLLDPIHGVDETGWPLPPKQDVG
ncbi:MAG: hypothetical protein JWN69_2595 [Alphaproteobacteria bacterium]|nr:hypothetical protein [Alphaproteobacteria bacterium]